MQVTGDPDRALAAGQRALDLAATLGDVGLAGRERISTWGRPTARLGDYPSGGRVLAAERGDVSRASCSMSALA